MMLIENYDFLVDVVLNHPDDSSKHLSLCIKFDDEECRQWAEDYNNAVRDKFLIDIFNKCNPSGYWHTADFHVMTLLWDDTVLSRDYEVTAYTVNIKTVTVKTQITL